MSATAPGAVAQCPQRQHAAAQEQLLAAGIGQDDGAAALKFDELDAGQAFAVAANASAGLALDAAGNLFQRVEFVGAQFFVFHCSYSMMVPLQPIMVRARTRRGKLT
ncbi:hypothetical protein [Massilia eburnea]|uniref:hypothetical protein n=1 Tax=Massilia eburnea TaxID=1776165 RepID=UPI003D6A7E85